ncbi:aspartate/glutamate racemase family protein [Neomegalonema sp.]|uniref:aspartate/glutamate racemase family protein n=1 Tax=Neomegalonema sp. TaxID=2039713 RepID=UPI002608B295|nr:aspartate/glutamate racemase family protein [Neomegalonema sp.]MDD2867929.1 aspartate/glutamate racemase family protein [Neomegalonema sp.]
MKTIGLIGGMSCESTALYYDQLNKGVRARLGGLNSAPVLLWSVNFAEIVALQKAGDWDEAGRRLAGIARRLEGAGAEVVALATNTMHKVAEPIQEALTVPFLHIGDAAAAALARDGRRRPGLLATAYTMEQSFYLDRLRAAGLAPLVPPAQDRAAIQRAIFEELCQGIVTPETRRAFQDFAAGLEAEGADSLILGCTEICMALKPGETRAPLYDTTALHVEALLDASLGPARAA